MQSVTFYSSTRNAKRFVANVTFCMDYPKRGRLTDRWRCWDKYNIPSWEPINPDGRVNLAETVPGANDNPIPANLRHLVVTHRNEGDERSSCCSCVRFRALTRETMVAPKHPRRGCFVRTCARWELRAGQTRKREISPNGGNDGFVTGVRRERSSSRERAWAIRRMLNNDDHVRSVDYRSSRVIRPLHV